MKVITWGSRGSLPASLNANVIRSKIARALEAAQGRDLSSTAAMDKFIDSYLPFAVKGTYGTNTTCVEIRTGQAEREYLVIDCGSGLRDFGAYLMKTEQIPAHVHILVTHPHWDHLHGFPFFVPAYIPGNRIDIYAYHEDIEQAFRKQQSDPFFPVSMDVMQADITFHQLNENDPFELNGCRIQSMQQHPGISYGYRLSRDGKVVVFSSDSEHKSDAHDDKYPFIEFFSDADLLIFDAQYTLTDSLYAKEDWGHSSNIMGVELAMRAGVKHLCLFHSEPTASDDELDQILESTKRYAVLHDSSYELDVSHAYDGMELDI
ncbi:MAG: MBL fold metallo-hydrolase [Candidatus Latescibacteria bacterium]|nr:MBL fold metallo-hydrolase [Candidatus Latescibacterota bacterium]